MAIEQPALEPGEAAEANLRLNVRTLLALRGKRMKDLARHLNLSPQGVSRRLTGETEWTYKEAARTADFLGVSLTKLQRDMLADWGAEQGIPASRCKMESDDNVFYLAPRLEPQVLSRASGE